LFCVTNTSGYHKSSLVT